MIVVNHEDDYFERTPIEKQRVCCNCRNRKASEVVSKYGDEFCDVPISVAMANTEVEE